MKSDIYFGFMPLDQFDLHHPPTRQVTAQNAFLVLIHRCLWGAIPLDQDAVRVSRPLMTTSCPRA